MSEIWKPQPIENYKSWIDSIIEEASDDLSAWESSFIASIDEQLGNRRNLSERQAEVLERIYTEKTK